MSLRSTRLGPDGSSAVEACLACTSSDLFPVLDLGSQPLANNLVSGGSATPRERSFPLGIQLCQSCLLVQLTHIVDPAMMFRSYLYIPSASSTWLQHCEELAAYVCTQAGLEAGELVVEIGSNDGTLLRAFQRRGQQVLGVDPAANIVAQANAAGVPTLNRFFSEAVARQIRRELGVPRAVVSTNVLAHVPDSLDVLRGVRALLGPNSVYVNESPSLREMVLNNEFDTIYHEHVSYFSLHALENLTRRAGLRIVDAVPQAVHGGSLRVLAIGAESVRQPSPDLMALRSAEQAAGVLDANGLRDFAERAVIVREELRALISGLRADGLRLAAYGATAKGNVLLAYCGLGRAEIEYIVDRNTLKQGLVTPGSRIPIASPELLRAHPPEVLLVLAWNLADEVCQQLAWFSEQGGRFLIPIPYPRLA